MLASQSRRTRPRSPGDSGWDHDIDPGIGSRPEMSLREPRTRGRKASTSLPNESLRLPTRGRFSLHRLSTPAAAEWLSRPRLDRRALAVLLLSAVLTMGSSAEPPSALEDARAEKARSLRQAPLPLSSRQCRIPQQELLHSNRTRLTRPATQEFLRNGGFEMSAPHDETEPRDWQRRYWTPLGNKPEVAAKAVVRSSTRRHRDRYALQLDSAFGNDEGRAFSAHQKLPVETLRGHRIRYSLWSYLETHPHPDMDPVVTRLRQWQAGRVIQQDLLRIASSRGHWQRDELVLRILENAEDVDVTVSVANTHYSSEPTVVFLDDISVTLADDELLAVVLPVPEQEKKAGVLPIDCRISDELRGHAPFSITHFVTKEGACLGEARLTVSQTTTRSVISLDALQPGPYELVSVLTLPQLGPVMMVRNSFLVYDGPFARDQ